MTNRILIENWLDSKQPDCLKCYIAPLSQALKPIVLEISYRNFSVGNE